jgi:hypothetical protein
MSDLYADFFELYQWNVESFQSNLLIKITKLYNQKYTMQQIYYGENSVKNIIKNCVKF